MRFSIVIPNLNSPIIHKTIKSLENQDFDPAFFEIIVVGVDRFGLVATSDRVRFDCSEHPLPPAAARNRGASQARGEILLFMDADTIADPELLKVMANRFSSPEVKIVGGSVVFFSDNYWTLADNISMFHEYLDFQPPGTRAQLPSINLAIRKEVFQAIGGFDERYPKPAGEDSDLTIRLRNKGEILNFEPKAIVKHLPPRRSFLNLIHHGFFQGKYSIKVDPRHIETDGLPWPFHTRFGVLITAPIMALAAATHIFLSNRSLWKYWLTFPAIYCSKLAWCIGAATHPW